jgi:UDP-N-acetylglucosamine transferase subunit ALG13
MIFVTVGTHEQQFNRLIKEVDQLVKDHVIQERVVIQIGYSTYRPEHCEWSNWYSYQEMVQLVEEARIVITHGGPSSFIMPLQIGKVPIVVPRQKHFDEHVNDHQLLFTKAVAERKGTIIVIEDIHQLKDVIVNYDAYVQNTPLEVKNNNANFNRQLSELVDEMMKQ